MEFQNACNIRRCTVDLDNMAVVHGNIAKHYGHDIECVRYGNETSGYSYAVECWDCNEVLVDDTVYENREG